MKFSEVRMDFDLKTLYVRFEDADDVSKAFQLLTRRKKVNQKVALDTELLQYLRQGLKIDAIKRHREVTHVGLKDSKDYVDALQAKFGV